MFDFSWGEVLLIGAVALIVIGPKDLPAALRTVGRMIGKIKRMASEFQGQFNEALREADLDHVRKEVEGMNRAASAGFNPVKTIRDEVKGAIDKPGSASKPAASGAGTSAAALAGTKVGAQPEAAAASETRDTKTPAAKPEAKADEGRSTAPAASKGAASAKSDKPAAPAPKASRKASSRSAGSSSGEKKPAAAAKAAGRAKSAAGSKKEEKQS